MKTIAVAVLMVGMFIGTVSEAGAAVCARGVYRAGCAGPHGAAVVHRTAPIATIAPAGASACAKNSGAGERVCPASPA